MKHINRKIITLIILSLLLGSCNLPSQQQSNDAAFTAAAQTVSAQLTAAAPAFFTATLPPANIPSTNTSAPPSQPPPPTLPPAATFTSTPICDMAQFITDVTIPDETKFDPNATFTKTWRVKNIGNCTWTGYSAVFDTGEAMNGASPTAIGTTPPGGQVDIPISMKAPSNPGNYRGYWRIRNASGALIPIEGGFQGVSFYVDIKVKSPDAPTATNTSPAPVFAVTSVTYIASTFNEGTYVNCPTVTASITANGVGDVTYHWTRSDGSSGSVQSIHFDAAGTKNVSEKWYLGSAAAGTFWMGVYVDTPNHQDFGHTAIAKCTAP